MILDEHDVARAHRGIEAARRIGEHDRADPIVGERPRRQEDRVEVVPFVIVHSAALDQHGRAEELSDHEVPRVTGDRRRWKAGEIVEGDLRAIGGVVGDAPIPEPRTMATFGVSGERSRRKAAAAAARSKGESITRGSVATGMSRGRASGMTRPRARPRAIRAGRGGEIFRRPHGPDSRAFRDRARRAAAPPILPAGWRALEAGHPFPRGQPCRAKEPCKQRSIGVATGS